MERRDVVIIGGGPAGLSAARRFSELGIAATVLEREQQAGGVPRHCGHMGFGWESHRRIWTGPRFAAQLREDSQKLDVRTGHSVLGIDGDVLRVQNQNGITEMCGAADHPRHRHARDATRAALRRRQQAAWA